MQRLSITMRGSAEYDGFYARNIILEDSLNLPVYLGIPKGLLRSIRFSVSSRRNARGKIQGILRGLTDTWRHRADSTPVRLAMWRSWIAYQAEWHRFCRRPTMRRPPHPVNCPLNTSHCSY